MSVKVNFIRDGEYSWDKPVFIIPVPLPAQSNFLNPSVL